MKKENVKLKKKIYSTFMWFCLLWWEKYLQHSAKIKQNIQCLDYGIEVQWKEKNEEQIN
jgi:hypothetical protein